MKAQEHMSTSELEQELISHLLDLSREEYTLPTLGKKVIRIINKHPLLHGRALALWCVGPVHPFTIIGTQSVTENLQESLNATISYHQHKKTHLDIQLSPVHASQTQSSFFQIDISLEKTTRYLFGLSLWSESEHIHSLLNTAYFRDFFSLINLVLLRCAHYSAIEYDVVALNQQIVQLTLEEERYRHLKQTYEALLRHQAIYDNLTNLPNRFYGYSSLERAIAKAQTHNNKLAILFLDLDEFKQVNKCLGHAAGDSLLKILAEHYSTLIAPQDTLVRLGSDEFMIITEEISTHNYPEELAQKCQELYLRPFKLESEELFISSSIGIAVYPEHGSDAKTLMRNADAAMAQSKSRGKNNCTLFIDTMAEIMTKRIRMISELHQALSRNEMVIAYQPIVQLKDDSVVAVEALLRWNSPVFGEVMPDQIISLAEETGLIVPLGYWVLRTVCAELKAREQSLNQHLKIAVNVSVVQLKQKDFIDQVKQILAITGVSPKSLIFEITESAFIDDSELILTQLKLLKKMKIECSLDDFGIGYSSLNYLRSYPFKSLKIDRTFIHGIAEGNDELHLVSSIIAMSHNLKLSVVAEGVETMKQYELLSAMNCDMVQGWYFSPALTSDELLSYLT